MSWFKRKKDLASQPIKFIPLETFKKRNSNPGLLGPREKATHKSAASIVQEFEVIEPFSSKLCKTSRNGMLVKQAISFESANNHSDLNNSIERADCSCVEALKRKKKVNLGPPVPPPRPKSTIELQTSNLSPEQPENHNLDMSFRNDLKLMIPPPNLSRRDNIPNLVVTYSKLGAVHHTTQSTPPSCGGVQPRTTSFDDTLTPPPSYDSAINTQDKHFSMYSVHPTTTPSIT